MKNIVVKNLENDYVKLIAKPGYKLYNKKSRKYYGEAVTLSPEFFEAIHI